MYRLIQPMFDECCAYEEFENGINTIQGESFRKLMDVCFDVASYFSFTVAPWDSCTETGLEKELEPFLIKKIHVQKWFCFDLSPSNRFLEVCIYKAMPSTKNILLKYFVEVFLRELENDSMVDSNQTLGDRCIFTETSLLMGTVTHECICHVYPPNEIVEREFLLSGRWKYSEDVSSEQIEIDGVI